MPPVKNKSLNSMLAVKGKALKNVALTITSIFAIIFLTAILVAIVVRTDSTPARCFVTLFLFVLIGVFSYCVYTGYKGRIEPDKPAPILQGKKDTPGHVEEKNGEAFEERKEIDLGYLKLLSFGFSGFMCTMIIGSIILLIGLAIQANLSPYKVFMAVAFLGWPIGIGYYSKKYLNEAINFYSGALKSIVFSAASGLLGLPLLIALADLRWPSVHHADWDNLALLGALSWGFFTMICFIPDSQPKKQRR